MVEACLRGGVLGLCWKVLSMGFLVEMDATSQPMRCKKLTRVSWTGKVLFYGAKITRHSNFVNKLQRMGTENYQTDDINIWLGVSSPFFRLIMWSMNSHSFHKIYM